MKAPSEILSGDDPTCIQAGKAETERALLAFLILARQRNGWMIPLCEIARLFYPLDPWETPPSVFLPHHDPCYRGASYSERVKDGCRRFVGPFDYGLTLAVEQGYVAISKDEDVVIATDMFIAAIEGAGRECKAA